MQSDRWDSHGSGPRGGGGGGYRGAGGARRGGKFGRDNGDYNGDSYVRPGRPAPYQREPAAPASSADGKWKHDLFAQGSSLYSPALSSAAMAARERNQPSSSLRPFGSATPAAPQQHQSYDIAPPNPAAAAVAEPSSLLSRFDVKGASSDHADNQRREAEKRARIAEQKKEKLKRDAERRAEQQRQQAAAEREIQRRIAEHEDTGHVVQVEGLVYGTSAEDVQTAFGAYGETNFCFIVNETTAKQSDDLIARLTFKLHDQAVMACNKLNGAIADGKPLKVTQVKRTPFPPEEPDLVVTGAVTAGPRQTAARAVSNGHVASAPAVPVVPATNPFGRRMYADEVEAFDPRAVTVTDQPDDVLDYGVGGAGDNSMDLDDYAAPSEPAFAREPAYASQAPARDNFNGPRFASRGGRGGSGRGGGAFGGAAGRAAGKNNIPTGPAAMRVPAAAPSSSSSLNLLDRLNQQGAGSRSTARPQQQKQPGGSGGSSLLNRLK